MAKLLANNVYIPSLSQEWLKVQQPLRQFCTLHKFKDSQITKIILYRKGLITHKAEQSHEIHKVQGLKRNTNMKDPWSGDLPIPISRAPSSMSIPAAPIVTDQYQIKQLHKSWKERKKKKKLQSRCRNETKSIEWDPIVRLDPKMMRRRSKKDLMKQITYLERMERASCVIELWWFCGSMWKRGWSISDWHLIIWVLLLFYFPANLKIIIFPPKSFLPFWGDISQISLGEKKVTAPTVGFEPTTTRLRALRSTSWARRACCYNFTLLSFYLL